MSHYSNQVNVYVNEIVRLTFNEMDASNNIKGCVEVVMLPEMINVLHETLGRVIEDHKAKQAGLAQVNKDLN